MIVLQALVADALNLTPGWLIPIVEGALLLLLLALDPGRMNREEKYLRVLGLTFVGAAAIANGYAALVLIYGIVTGKPPVHGMSPANLLLTGGAVWLTNVIVFALVYWELDSGGPAARANARRDRPDYLFPQMTAPDLARPDWEPGFIDYLYVAYTNATAFSPTDTMPMTRWAKLTMMFQSTVSVALIALVIARSVNILNT
ncbi:MAG: DUF1345 domain-containing protein [Catenulispora sp.]|nr:DUF1345 domain-containing protein [Catenulispora sp.]